MAGRKEPLTLAAREASDAAIHLNEAYSRLSSGWQRHEVVSSAQYAIRLLRRALMRMEKAFPDEEE